MGTRRSKVQVGFVVALAGAFVSACTDKGTDLERQQFGVVAFQPVYPATAAPSAFGLVLNNVRIQLTRPPDEIVVDTIVQFDPEADEIQVNVQVPLFASSESFSLLLEMRSDNLILFSGTQTVTVNDTV